MALITRYEKETRPKSLGLTNRQNKVMDLFGPTGKWKVPESDIKPKDKRTLGSLLDGLERSRGYIGCEVLPTGRKMFYLTVVGLKAKTAWEQVEVDVADPENATYPKRFLDQIKALNGDYTVEDKPKHKVIRAKNRPAVREMGIRKSA